MEYIEHPKKKYPFFCKNNVINCIELDPREVQNSMYKYIYTFLFLDLPEPYLNPDPPSPIAP